MKLMNEIESEFDGEVIEICVNNEDVVEYGTPLFKIRQKENKILQFSNIFKDSNIKHFIN